MSDVANEMRMPLLEHLGELRKRLFRCVIVILILGAASLVLARPIFFVLMRPVLDALPETGRSLIYTSGIEELNVLMKVGLYAGIFLATPVLLWEIWGFVSPGLLPTERRFAGPFVFLGTVAFLTGALFCYFVLLPTMFQFLLETGDTAPLRDRIALAKEAEAESLRYLRIGELERAGGLAEQASDELGSSGEGQIQIADGAGVGRQTELVARMDALGRMIDAIGVGVGQGAQPLLRGVMQKRLEAFDALHKGDLAKATALVDDAANKWALAGGAQSRELLSVWNLERQLARGQDVYARAAWTRPMLTMSEQLTLVLMLELALGVIFELPLVMALLGMLGILNSKLLMRYQRHAFLLCLAAAAIITPTGDAINLSIMAGPMFLCYELGVLAVWIVERRRKDADAGLTPAV
jgi:sec-independent protein translocase protein TatC